jgi:hypothetical protein
MAGLGIKKWLLLILLLVLGCGRHSSFEEHEETMVVYSMLSPSNKLQQAFVDKIYAMADTASEGGLSGAKVVVWETLTGDSIFFEEIPDSAGFYQDTLDSIWVKPATIYNLSVIHETDTVKAHVTTVDTFNILSLKNGDTVNLANPPPFIWFHSQGTEIYIIMPTIPGDTTYIGAFLPLATTDTSINLFAYHQTYFDSTTWYTIRVIGLDEAASNYFTTVAGETRIDTLDGGIGLFGSFATDTVKVYVKGPG